MDLLPRRLLTVCFRGLVGVVCVVCFLLTACEPTSEPIGKDGTPVSSVGVLKSRIVRGYLDISHPAVGALMVDGVPFCSGTLVAQRVVLTAAHCVTPLEQLGSRKLFFRVDIPTGVTSFRSVAYEMDAKLSQAHPEFELTGNIQNDIGYIVLKKAVQIVRPMPIYSEKVASDWIGRWALVVGYGRLSGDAYSTSPTKQSINLSIKAIEPLDEITRATKKNVVLLNSHQRSACQGDSGGPSLVVVGGKTMLLGVSSHISNPTCRGNTYSFLAGPYIKWIQDAMTRFSPCSDSTSSCGACASCQSGSCRWQEPDGTGSCKECKANDECGVGGLCASLKDGKRCLRPCSGDGCCPSGFVCSQMPGKQGKFCMPETLSCSLLACQKDKDCKTDEVCLQGECKPKGAKRDPSTCFPCDSDADCGQGGTCHKANGVGGRCYQACASGGTQCPSGFRCERLSGSLRCVPDDLTCRIPCDGATCPSGFVCQDNTCKRAGGGRVGDPCAPDLPCESSLRCASSSLGSRCYEPCGAKAGTVGASCLPGRVCEAGLTCMATKTGKEVCVELCTPESPKCTQGGVCRGFCVCDKDSDCQAGQFCRLFNLSLGGGVCRSKKIVSCSAGDICTEEDVCIPDQAGSQQLWGACDAVNRCDQGSQCIPELNRCLRSCKTQTDCKGAGQCFGDEGSGFCACVKDADCGTGFRCQSFEKEGPGFCVEDKKTCPSSGCPDGTHCVSGSCVDLLMSVDEPSKEAQKNEQTAPDGGLPESTQSDTSQKPSAGCGCSTGNSEETDFPLWVLLGVLFFMLSCRRSVRAGVKRCCTVDVATPKRVE